MTGLEMIAISITAGGVKKLYDTFRKNKKTEKITKASIEKAEKIKKEYEEKKKETVSVLEELGKLKLEVWANEIHRFVSIFEKIKNVQLEGEVSLDNVNLNDFKPENIGTIKQASLNAKEILTGGLGALGTGALTGIATYSAVMTWGAASTNTAIATLSGAAATNATLAWLGGGSLAAGGGGMSAGLMVLGGIVTAPIILVTGLLLDKKAQRNLAEAKAKNAEVTNFEQQVKTMITTLDNIRFCAKQYSDLISNMKGYLRALLKQLNVMVNNIENEPIIRDENMVSKIIFAPYHFIQKIYIKMFKPYFNGRDFNTYSHSHKKFLFNTLNVTQVLKNLLETPILKENTGEFVGVNNKMLKEAKSLLNDR